MSLFSATNQERPYEPPTRLPYFPGTWSNTRVYPGVEGWMLKFPIDRRMRLCLFHIFQQKRLNRFFFSFLASLIKNKNYIYPQGVKSSEAYSEASSFFFFFSVHQNSFRYSSFRRSHWNIFFAAVRTTKSERST